MVDLLRCGAHDRPALAPYVVREEQRRLVTLDDAVLVDFREDVAAREDVLPVAVLIHTGGLLAQLGLELGVGAIGAEDHLGHLDVRGYRDGVRTLAIVDEPGVHAVRGPRELRLELVPVRLAAGGHDVLRGKDLDGEIAERGVDARVQLLERGFHPALRLQHASEELVHRRLVTVTELADMHERVAQPHHVERVLRLHRAQDARAHDVVRVVLLGVDGVRHRGLDRLQAVERAHDAQELHDESRVRRGLERAVVFVVVPVSDNERRDFLKTRGPCLFSRIL